MAETVPPWCESAPGSSHVLIVAPHGGFSPGDLLTASAAGRRANDLHTAGLARELAERLAGARVINTACDRNELDLNRVGDVQARAPWFFATIEQRLREILDRHARALVLFVHGWHVGQARCDLGIGATLGAATEAAARADVLTANPNFVSSELEAFRRRLAGHGVLATYGERWPAAHRNNVMRLFRRRDDGRQLSEPIRRWVFEDRVDAVQLELGVPLRWPGGLREGLLAAATSLVDGAADGPGAGARSVPPGQAGTAGDVPQGASLQAFDPQCGPEGLGLVVGAMPLSHKEIGARLQVFPGGQRMGIFTGHGRVGHGLGVPDLWFEPTPAGFDVRFDGHLLESRDAAEYFRFEQRQADAVLREATLRLRFEESSGGFGHVHGSFELGSERWEIDAGAFRNVRRTEGGTAGRFGTRILVSSDRASALRLDLGGAGECTLSRLGPQGWRETRHPGRIAEKGGGRFVVHLEDSEPLHLRLRTQTSLLRPVGPSDWVRTTFGVVHAQWESGGCGDGFYEDRRPL